MAVTAAELVSGANVYRIWLKLLQGSGSGLLSSYRKAGAGQVVLVRLMETDRNGVHQHQASYVERK